MVTVCTGWTEPRHATIVLKPEDGGQPGVSHGMCKECERRVLSDYEADEQYKHHRELHERADRYAQENER